MSAQIYRIEKRAVVTLVFMLVSVFSLGADSLFLDADFKKETLTEYITVFDTAELLSVETVMSISEKGNLFKPVETTSFGFSTHYFWIRLRLINKSPLVSKSVIVVNNPHIDFLQAWEYNSDKKPLLIYTGGDKIPFGDRTFLNRNLVIPLEMQPGAIKTILMTVDKRNASVSVPMLISRRSVFEEREESNHLVYGIYFGILLVIIVFSLFVFSILRQEIFFWYAFYIFFLGLYLMAHIGILFQIGYPNMNWFNDYSRPFFITFSTSALIHFIRLLLNVKRLLPRLNVIYNYLIIILNATVIWWMITPWWHEVQTIIYLNIQNFTLLAALILVLVSSILTFKDQKVVVAFFWVAFMAVLSAGLSIILIESGIINEDAISINPLFIGSLIEVLVFALGLSYWSRVNENDRLQLIKLVQDSKKQMVDSYINGIESEKQKISSDLHDDIGSRLSHLKRKTESDCQGHPEIIKRFEKITQKVRLLSHDLAPPSFAGNEFLISIKHLVSSHELPETEMTLQIFDIPDYLSSSVTKHLYRIVQSALSNIEKYAKATSVDIQFFYYNNELVLAIEDNGIGFDYSKENPVMSITEMQSRVESLGGLMEISSSKKRGTSIMITIPV